MNSSINNFQSTKRTAPRFNSEMKADFKSTKKTNQNNRRQERALNTFTRRLSANQQGDH